jgi:hypothetical protein
MHALLSSSSVMWMGNFYGKYQKTFQELYLLFRRIIQGRKFINVLYFFNIYMAESLKKSLTAFSMAPLVVLLPDTLLIFVTN